VAVPRPVTEMVWARLFSLPLATVVSTPAWGTAEPPPASAVLPTQPSISPMTTAIANNDFQLLCLISTRLLGNTPLVFLMGDGSLAAPVY